MTNSKSKTSTVVGEKTFVRAVATDKDGNVIEDLKGLSKTQLDECDVRIVLDFEKIEVNDRYSAIASVVEILHSEAKKGYVVPSSAEEKKQMKAARQSGDYVRQVTKTVLDATADAKGVKNMTVAQRIALLFTREFNASSAFWRKENLKPRSERKNTYLPEHIWAIQLPGYVQMLANEVVNTVMYIRWLNENQTQLEEDMLGGTGIDFTADMSDELHLAYGVVESPSTQHVDGFKGDVYKRILDTDMHELSNLYNWMVRILVKSNPTTDFDPFCWFAIKDPEDGYRILKQAHDYDTMVELRAEARELNAERRAAEIVKEALSMDFRDERTPAQAKEKASLTTYSYTTLDEIDHQATIEADTNPATLTETELAASKLRDLGDIEEDDINF